MKGIYVKCCRVKRGLALGLRETERGLGGQENLAK